jgi:hypothetical protein
MMTSNYETDRLPCKLAAALGIVRYCIRGHSCRGCAFEQWLDDTSVSPQVKSSPEKESESFAIAA